MYVGTVIVHNEEEELAVRGVAKVEPPAGDWRELQPALREDGPTIHEWVAHGLSAKEYPPKGFAVKSPQEEIEQAIKDEEAAAAKSAGWGM
jgi:hypothetical protein